MTSVDPAERASSSAPTSGISRRTLVKGAAWAVPAIAIAAPAPAFAASGCTPTTSFDDLRVGASPSTIVFLPSGVTAGLKYASNSQGNDSTPGGTGQVAQTSTNPSWKYIEIEMVEQLTVGEWVTMTITLSQAVSGLSFILHDIDKVSGQWEDRVEILTPGFTFQLGNNVQGAGTAANPFNPISWGDTPIDSGRGDVRLTWAGSVQQVVIKYIAGITGNSGNQHIGLGNLSYSACLPNARQARLAAGAAVEVQVNSEPIQFVETDGTQDL